MILFKFVGQALTPEVLKGIDHISEQLGFAMGEEGIEVELKSVSKGIVISKSESNISLGYSKRVELFRALGLIMERILEPSFEVAEESSCQMLGAMVDNSRNAVMNISSIKRIIRYMAVMGLNTLMLYTEDTYEIEGYPYFGYMRGRFTPEELRECDSYADMFGIELVPCIQTLAHLNAALRWQAFNDIRDVNDILLVGSEKTYELIDAMLSTMSENIKSRNINIGMDEAHMIGLGKYLDLNGYQNRSEIMLQHLNRVVQICQKYGYKPMMWSDMFFRLASSGSYYECQDIPKEVLEKVPEGVSLVYWDYYNNDPQKVARMLDMHLKFDNPCVFAGGAWRWTGFVPANGFSLLNSRVILQECKKKGIDKMFVTAWGDNGSECSMFTILPILQLFAENCYTGNMSDSHLDKRLKTCTGISLDDFLLLDEPNYLPGNEKPGACSVNPTKYLLYQDILLGLFDRHVKVTYSEHFVKTSCLLKGAAERNPLWAKQFLTLAHLCDVLAIKCDMGIRLKKAYDTKDTMVLQDLCHEMEILLNYISVFHEDIRKQWMDENKPFGFEVLSIRFGALKERINEAKRRVEEFISGTVERIEELEQERLYYDGRLEEGESIHLSVNLWDNIVSASVL